VVSARAEDAQAKYTLRVLMEKAREYHRPLHICFVDLRKAYDSVDRHTLWLVLQHCYYLPLKLLTIIKALQDHTSATVRSYGEISDPFSVSVGVEQVRVLAPTLFNLFFDAMIWLAIADNHSGVRLSYLLDADLVGNRKKLTSDVSVSDLEYADDMALISDSFDVLTTLLESLDSTCCLMGLSINYKKTTLLSVLLKNSSQSPSPILLHLDCESIAVIPSFQYLGSIVSSDCTSDTDLLMHHQGISVVWGTQPHTLAPEEIRRDTKLSIFNSVVLSTLLYGLETAVLLESQINCLQSLVMCCLHSTLGVSLWDGQRETPPSGRPHTSRESP